MEATERDIDLIDDIWRRIFTILDCKCRASLFQVSKRWKVVASGPLCWNFLDVKFPSFGSKSEAKERIDSFAQFVAKYCTLTTKIRIEQDSFMFWTGLMRALSPLSNLRYLKVILSASGNIVTLQHSSLISKPNWPNLIYFNLQTSESFAGWLWELLTEGMPNLEELHLANMVWPTMERDSFIRGLGKCPKIKLLTLPDTSRMQTLGVGSPDPQVQYLVLMESIYERLPELQTVFVQISERQQQGRQPFQFGRGRGGFGGNLRQDANPFGGGGFGFGAPNQAANPFGGIPQFGGGGFGFGAPNQGAFGQQQFGGGFGGNFGQPANPFEARPPQARGNTTPPLFEGPPPFGEQKPVQPEPEPELEYHDDTLILTKTTMRSRNLETVKKISHVIKKSNYVGYFTRHQSTFGGTFTAGPLTEPLMHYLINELKLDINCCSTRADPFAVDIYDVFNIHNPVYPLTAVLSEVDQVQLMLDFGADPNYPDAGYSPLSNPRLSKDSCILLLENGADPLKLDVGSPAIKSWFINFADEDLVEVLAVALNNGVDVNQKIGDFGTLLDLSITDEHPQTMQKLLALGAQWTPTAMEKLIHLNDKLWADVITSGKFDVSQLLLSTALVAVKLGMYPLVREFLQNVPRDLDQNGFGLVHYLTLLAQNDTLTLKQRKTGFMRFGEPSHFSEDDLLVEGQQLDHVIKDLKLDVNLKTSNGETALLLACSDFNEGAKVVEVLIDNGANVNEPNAYGWTPLHAAVFGTKNKTLQLLLLHGANINAQDLLGITPAMAFIVSPNTPGEDFMHLWNLIIEHGFDTLVVDKNMNRSILHYLASFKTHRCLEILLDKVPGLDLNCRDVHGFTPLHYAALSELQDHMRVLVEHGANTNATSDTLKLTPFAALMALHSKTVPYTRYLESYGRMNRACVITERTNIFVGPDKSLLCGLNRPVWCDPAVKPAHSVNPRSPALSKQFIPWPTDLSLTDQFGNNMLHMASPYIDKPSDKMGKEVPNELHKFWSKPNKRGTTPLHELAKHFEFDHINFLLNLLAEHEHELIYSFNNKDEHGKTALEYLFEKPSIHDFAFALYQVPGINFTSPTVIPQPRSLLHSTISRGTVGVDLLTKLAETDPSALNLKIDGKTPLMLYVETLLTDPNVTFQVGLFDWFLSHKEVDLNAQDNEGNTALHYACYFFHLGAWEEYYTKSVAVFRSAPFSVILFKLLEGGARVGIKNNEGQAPIDILPNILQLDRSLVPLLAEHGLLVSYMSTKN